MGDEQTASTLLLAAGIIQIILGVIFTIIGVGLTAILIPSMFYFTYPIYFGWWLLFPLLLFGSWGVIGLIVGILWLGWRNNPSEHKTGLIVSGILGMLFLGTVPGILVLIAGATTPSPSEYRPYEPVRKPTVRVVVSCSTCGAELTSEDRFCWRCGSKK